MGRRLPWEKNPKPAAPAGTQPRTPVKQATVSSSPPSIPLRSTGATKKVERASPTSHASSARPNKKRKTLIDEGRRNRNQSPHTLPSASPCAPPRIRYMIDGLDNDDKWRLVEDEFLATAKSFTAHLHAAEYQRLEAEARLRDTGRSPGASGNIMRPVVGVMTDSVSRRANIKERASRMGRGIGAAKCLVSGKKYNVGVGDAAGPLWVGTSLQGLMESTPETTVSSLVDVVLPGGWASDGVPSRTQTIATGDHGTQAGHPHVMVRDDPVLQADDSTDDGDVHDLDINDAGDEDDEDDEDDLDAPPRSYITARGQCHAPIDQSSHPTHGTRVERIASSRPTPNTKPTSYKAGIEPRDDYAPKMMGNPDQKTKLVGDHIGDLSFDNDHDDDLFGIRKRREARLNRCKKKP